MIELFDVLAARDRLGDRIRVTPMLEADVETPGGAVPVLFKLEHLQHSGCFKFRGSMNTLLAADGVTEVVVASGGNAGIGAATAAQMLGIRCAVVVPVTAPPAKVQLLVDLGAEAILHGRTYAEAAEQASQLAGERGALQLHAYDLPGVVAGAGVIGLELDEQTGSRDPVLVAVGGGGLVAGIAAATDRRIIGVEPVGAPTLNQALAHGEPVDVGVDSIAADALGATRLGSIAMDVVKRRDVASLLVSDEAIVAARRYLWRNFRIAVEWAGATALAALTSGAYVPGPGERPVLVLCGANTDPGSLA